jgi:hypothetical protein
MSSAVLVLLPATVHAQNTSFGSAVHLLVGQSPVRVTLPTATPVRFYDAVVVGQRSYCAEASGSENEINPTDPTLTVYAADQTTTLGSDTGTTVEPKGLTASRVCFIAPASGLIYIRIQPESGFEDREYTLRIVETTLYTNWFFVGDDYSSFTLIRNTTNTPVSYKIFWRNLAGGGLGVPQLGSIPANGVAALDARAISQAIAAISGSVEIAHTGSPEALIGTQTTLSGGTGLSFDTLFFQRRAW